MDSLVKFSVGAVAGGELLKNFEAAIERKQRQLMDNPYSKDTEMVSLKIVMKNDPNSAGTPMRTIVIEGCVVEKSNPHRYGKTVALVQGGELMVSVENAAEPMQPTLLSIGK